MAEAMTLDAVSLSASPPSLHRASPLLRVASPKVVQAHQKLYRKELPPLLP